LCWRDARQALPALLDMFQRYGDAQYLDQFEQRAHTIISYSQIKNGYPTWLGASGAAEELSFHQMAICGTLMRFANLVAGMPGYAASAALFRSVSEQVRARWESDWRWIDGQAGICVQRGRTLPNNCLGLAGIFLWELGDPRAQAIAEALRRVMRPHPTVQGAVIWDYANRMLASDPQILNARVDDANHAGSVASFAVLAMQDLLEAMRKTCLALWNGNPAQPVFKWRLDGTGDLPEDALPFYRHMELGPVLYPAIEAQWRHLVSYDHTVSMPGTYLSIPSLVLRHW
jgi:hypothetical protein